MKNPHPGGLEAGHLHRSLKAQLSGALCCLYGTRKESYFLGALIFSLMADTESSCAYSELAHEGSSWRSNLHKQKGGQGASSHG